MTLRWRREQKSWLGKWRPAAAHRHLNKRKKSDVSSIPMTILQNMLQFKNAELFLQNIGATEAEKYDDDVDTGYIFIVFVLFYLNSQPLSWTCFSPTLAPQQQLMSGRRNFLKEKQLDDISVSGENIISNKQQWKWQLWDESHMLVTVMTTHKFYYIYKAWFQNKFLGVTVSTFYICWWSTNPLTLRLSQSFKRASYCDENIHEIELTVMSSPCWVIFISRFSKNWWSCSKICWRAHRQIFDLITVEECEASQLVKHARNIPQP